MPIGISNVEIASDAEYGTALGVLTARAADDSVVDCVYSLSRGDSDLFVVSENQLLTAWRTPPATGIYPVRIRATGISTRFSGSATFMISVVDPPPPPPEPIPPQGAGPHFVIGANCRIKFAPPFELDSRGNLIGRIEELLPLVRRAADELAPHLTSNSFLITHYPQPSRSGTKQEHTAVSAGLNDGAQQGAISKGAQRGPVCCSLRNRGSVPGSGDALALAIRLCLPGLRRAASQLGQDPGALPVCRLSTADIRDRRNDFRGNQGAAVHLVSRHVPPHSEQGRHLQH